MPTTTKIIVEKYGLLSDNAICNAMFALSEFFKAFAVTIDKAATIIKSKPYKKHGKKKSAFSATKVVK